HCNGWCPSCVTTIYVQAVRACVRKRSTARASCWTIFRSCRPETLFTYVTCPRRQQRPPLLSAAKFGRWQCRRLEFPEKLTLSTNDYGCHCGDRLVEWVSLVKGARPEPSACTNQMSDGP